MPNTVTGQVTVQPGQVSGAIDLTPVPVSGTVVIDRHPPFRPLMMTLDPTQSPSGVILPLKNGVTYDFRIFWGDGTSDRITSHNQAETHHTYPGNGPYQIRIVGDLPQFHSSTQYNSTFPVVSIDDWGDVVFSSMQRACAGWQFLRSIPTGGNFSGVTNWREAFSFCLALEAFPLLDVSAGTDFHRTWESCPSMLDFAPLVFGPNADLHQAWYGGQFESFPAITLPAGCDVSTAWQECTAMKVFGAVDFTHVSSDMGTAFNNCNAIEQFLATNIGVGGASNIYINGNMDAAAINVLLGNLSSPGNNRIVDISGNPGEPTCDKSIGINKGWDVHPEP